MLIFDNNLAEAGNIYSNSAMLLDEQSKLVELGCSELRDCEDKT